MEMVTLWLLAAALAQSAIAMSVYLISLHEAPRSPAGVALTTLLGERQQRGRRSIGGFGGFGNLDTKSWFTWQTGGKGSQVGSASDFSPPDFAGFGGKKSRGHGGHGHGGHGHGGHGGHGGGHGGHGGGHGGHGGCKGCGRAEASLGPIFTTNVKDVPNETRNKFNKPQEKSTQERREKYNLNREFSTPPHAYRVAEEIPFFDTLDHKTVILTLASFRADNTIPTHKFKSIRPFFPFFIKD